MNVLREEVGGVMVDAPRDEAGARFPAPTWALLSVLFAFSFFFRFFRALRDPAPWIFNDEIQYSELAKSIGYSGELAIRGVEGTGGFPFLYPLLISPAFALFERVPDGYDAVKAINCLLMSATLVPVYFLARRVAGRGWSLAAAGFTVAIPGLMFTSTFMTENAFYPIVALWLLTVVRALERPTIVRQGLVFVVMALAFLTRPQAVVLAAVLLGTLGLVLLLDAWPPSGRAFLRRLWVGARSFWPTWGIFAGLAAAAVARQAARDRPLNELLGSYGGVTNLGYEPDEFGTWALWHLAEANIFLGVLPFAAFIAVVLAGLRPAEDRSVRIVAALGLTTVGAFLLVVTAYASSQTGDRILERNFFHVAPLFFVALAAWGTRASVRRWWAVAPAALFAATVTLSLPINSLLTGTIVHSTPGLLPIWRWRERAFSPETIDNVVATAAIAGAVVFAFLPRRFSPVLIAVLAVYFFAASRPVESFTHQASEGAFESALGHPKDWIDRAVGFDADVSSIWVGGGDAFPFWESEVFNRSVGRTYTLGGAYDGLVHTVNHVNLQRDGRVLQPTGEPVRLQYALTDIASTFRGERVATNGAERMALFEVNGPLVLEERYDGLFPDRWSGEGFTYRRYGCRPGTLHLKLESSNALHPRRFFVTVLQHGRRTGRIRFSPREQFPEAAIRLEPRDGICDLALQIPTAYAERSTVGDTRYLGLRFLGVRYEPDR